MADLSFMVVDMDELPDVLRRCYKARVTPFVLSEPGVGKTHTVRCIDKEEDAHTVEFIGSQHDAVDLTGMPRLRWIKPKPDVEDGDITEPPVVTSFAQPDFIPRTGKGTFFIDDFGNSDKAVQVAAMQMALERRIGNALLPDDWRVCIASNTAAHASYITPPPASFKNRVVTVRVKPTLYGKGTPAVPRGWVKWAQEHGVHHSIIAFHVWTRGELLSKFNPTADSFPSPRAWTMLSNLVSVDPFPDSDTGDLTVYAEGTVGTEAGAKYTGFVRLFKNLPDVHGIFAGTIKESTMDAQTSYAMMSVLARHIGIGDKKPSEISNALNWARKTMPDEILAALIAILAAGWKPIMGNPTFQTLFQKLSSFRV